MRILVSFIITLSFLLSMIYLLLFTSSGNSFLKPYIEKEMSKKLEHNVTINSIVIKPDFLDMEINVDKNSKVILNGDIDIFSQNFNLTYDIDAADLKTPYVSIDSKIKMKGTLRGNPKLFDIDGQGKAFRSQITFETSIYNKKVKKLKIIAKALRIEDILNFLNKPVYSRGVFDLDADIVSTDEGQNYNGRINTLIQFGILNKSVIKNIFDIDLKHTVNYRGEITSKITNGIVKSKGTLYSNITNLKFENSSFDIKRAIFTSDFLLEIPNLELLEPIIKKKLYGKLILTGNIKKDNNSISFDAHTKKFNGDIDIKFIDNKAKILLSDLKVSDILKMLKLKRYINATLNGDIDIKNTKTLESLISLNMKNGRTYPNKIKEFININLPIGTNFSLTSKGIIKNNLLHVNLNFMSNLFNLNTENTLINLKQNDYNGTYNLNIPKLKKLDFLTKTKLRGKLTLKGNFKSDENTTLIDGKSAFLDSNSTFLYKNSNLNISIKNISTKKLSHMVYFPDVFESIANANLSYNFTDSKGNFLIEANNGKLTKNTLTDLVYSITKTDLTKEIYYNTILIGDIMKNIIDFNLNMNSPKSLIKIYNAKTDIKTQKIDADFFVKIDNKDLNGRIKGTINHPKINLKTSSYIKNKLEKVMEKKVPDKFKSPLKNLLDLFN